LKPPEITYKTEEKIPASFLPLSTSTNHQRSYINISRYSFTNDNHHVVL
jgi:hypothetical protein